jgi:hypothetical protein
VNGVPLELTLPNSVGFSAALVPEPSVIVLLGAGLLALAAASAARRVGAANHR